MARRSLKNLRVVITGASSGLGNSIAKQLDAAGAKLLLTARRADRLESLANLLDSKPILCPGDVTSSAHRDSLVEACQSEWNGLDVLINNAGVGAMGSFCDAHPSRLQRVMDVNFFAPAELTRLFIPMLKQSDRAVIINVSSVLGHTAVPDKSEYCASKFALHGFSDSIRGELAGDGIDVILVSPSTIKTEFFDSAVEDTTNTDWQRRPGMTPDYVATQTIKALKSGSREVILPLNGKLFVWFDRLFPGLSERMIRRFFEKQNKLDV